MLLPLPETGLLSLDLLCEPLAQLFLLLLELGVVQLLHLWFAEFTRFHLLLTVILIVRVFRRRDEIQHMRSDKQRTELLEVTMVLVLNCEQIMISRSHNTNLDGSPSATPQRYSRPLTIRPSEVFTSSVEPIIEKGMASVRIRAWSALSSSASTGGV